MKISSKGKKKNHEVENGLTEYLHIWQHADCYLYCKQPTQICTCFHLVKGYHCYRHFVSFPFSVSEIVFRIVVVNKV